MISFSNLELNIKIRHKKMSSIITYLDFPTPLSPVIKIFNVVNTEGSILAANWGISTILKRTKTRNCVCDAIRSLKT